MYSQQICEKYKFSKNLFTRSQVFPCGQTDRKTHKLGAANRRFRKFTNELKIPIQNQTHLHNAIIPYIGLLFLIFYSSCALDVTYILLQNWGNHADISQAVVIYVWFVSDVLLICWFGTQLTQHVRQSGLLLLLLTF